MKHFLILTAIFFLSLMNVSAQYNYYNYTTMDNIICLAEDGNNIWVGTYGGLILRNKSNGTLLATYTTNEGLLNNYIAGMALDLSGNLWIATGSGVQKFNGTSWESFTHENTAGAISNEGTETVYCDLHGNMWFSSWDNGVSKYDGTSWTNYNTTNSGIISNSVEDMAVDNSGNLWIAGGYGNGPQKYDGAAWTTYDTTMGWSMVDTSGGYTYYCSLNKVFVDAGNNIWFGTYKGGLSKFDGTTFTNYMHGYNVSEITVDAWNVFWIAATAWDSAYVDTSIGVWKFDGTTWTNYTSANSGLADDWVGDILVDSQGEKWFATVFGLSRFNDTDWNTYVSDNSFGCPYISDIADDSNGAFWFATCFGISKLTGTNTWTNFADTMLYNNGANALVIDNQNNKWIASKGLIKYNDTTYTYFLQNSGYFNFLLFDDTGKLWAGTDSGAYWLNPDGSVISHYDTLNSGLPTNDIHSIAIDKTGNIWFGTEESWNGMYHQDGGLAMFDGTSWTTYTAASTSGEMPGSSVNSIAVDTMNNIWASTGYLGITYFDGTNWTTYDTTNGLGSMYTTYLTIDSLNNKWVGSDTGIFKFDGANWENYMISDGLVSNTVYNIYIDHSGAIWVGTEQGISKMTCASPVSDFIADTLCFSGTPSPTHFINTSTETDNTSAFEWDINNDGITEYTSADIAYSFPSPGIYPVKLTVSNDNCAASVTKNVIVGFTPQISLTLPDSVSLCQNSSMLINATILNYDSVFNYNYIWSNGLSSSGITVNTSGTYQVTVSIENCHSAPDSVYIDVKQPFAGEQICVVTIDTTLDKNLIVWEKTPGAGIAFYNIYKETAANVYQPIGNLPYSAMSEYVDINSSPAVKSDRYKISAVDTCGNESPLSSFHKTMHLTVNVGTNNSNNLIWENYEGFYFGKYKIYRGTTLLNLQLIDSIQSNLTTYTDTFPPTGGVYYFIGIDLPAICAPLSGKANGGPYSQSVSNIEDNGMVNQPGQGVNNSTAGYEELKVYPNPMKEKAIVEFLNENHNLYILTITDATGKRVKEIKDIRTNKVEIDKTYLPGGFYLIEVSGERLFRGRLIVE